VVDGLPTGPLPVAPSLIEGQKASLPTTAISSNHHEVFHSHAGVGEWGTLNGVSAHLDTAVHGIWGV
jgi:hypothetical protein